MGSVLQSALTDPEKSKRGCTWKAAAYQRSHDACAQRRRALHGSQYARGTIRISTASVLLNIIEFGHEPTGGCRSGALRHATLRQFVRRHVSFINARSRIDEQTESPND